jgi:hypothetical protein
VFDLPEQRIPARQHTLSRRAILVRTSARHNNLAAALDSRPVLGFNPAPVHAKMAELADALDSGSSARKGVEVQVLFFAPK